MFGIDDAGVCRLIRRLEAIFASVMAIEKYKKLSREEMENLIIDATEQPLELPKRRQKPYDSGKRKRHTLKTEIRVTKKGRIVHVGKTHPDRCMILRFLKVKNVPPKKADFSFIRAIKALQTCIKTPIFPKNQAKNNTALSRFWSVFEHIFGDIKTFKIMSDGYRNKIKRYAVKFNIIAGIVNLKNSFP
jgi:hypothetical protein